MDLQDKIDQFKADGKNLFSSTECIMIALMEQDLYRALMPARYRVNPMAGYFALDAGQRTLVDLAHLGKNKNGGSHHPPMR